MSKKIIEESKLKKYLLENLTRKEIAKKFDVSVTKITEAINFFGLEDLYSKKRIIYVKDEVTKENE